MLRILSFSCFLFLGLSQASAQQVIGSITGVIDGFERVWYVTEMDANSRSLWTDRSPVTNVQIFGHVSENTITDKADGLSITFDMQDGEVVIPTIFISFIDASVEGDYVAAFVDTNIIELTTNTMLDGRLQLEGSFVTTMMYSENFGMSLDPENTKDIEAVFTVDIRQRR